MTNRLKGKLVLLTGGVANIGLAALESFVNEGAKVAIVDIDAERGLQVEKKFSENVKFFKADLSAEAQIRDVVSLATDWLGGLNTLCLNAGIQLSGKLEEFSVQAWDKVYAINVRSSFIFIQESLKYLRDAKKSSVILMSSLAGKRGAPGLSCYSSSKAAVIGLSNTLAIELAKDGVRVNAICPGWIDTPFNDPVIDFIGGKARQQTIVEAAIPLGRQATADEVAPLFVYLASDESSYVTAQAINVCGGAYN